MEITYQNKPLILSRSAMSEMFRFGYDMYDISEILEHGYDCARSKRSHDKIERCLDKKDKCLKVVIASSYNYSMNCEVWVVLHFGIVTKHR